VYQEDDDDILSSFNVDYGINLDSLVGDVEDIQVDDAEMESVSRGYHDSEMEDQDDSSDEEMDEGYMSSSDGLGIETLVIDDEDEVCVEKVKEKR
jgi:hypothetical protein